MITTEADYKAALAEIERLMDIDPDPGTDDGKKLDELATAVEAYEDKSFPN